MYAAGFIPTGGNYGQGPPPVPPTAAFSHQPGMYGASYGDEALHDEPKGFDFSDKTIRQGFIRKVYAILMCQLLLTLGVISLFLFHEPTKRYVQHHEGLFWAALVILFVSLICMACCTSVRRKAPMNFIFLFLFTGAESFMLGTLSSRYDSKEVCI